MKLKKLFFTFIIPFLLIGLFAAGLFLKNANKILKHELERFLGKGFSVGKIELHWGDVKAEQVRLLREDGKEALTSESILLRADFVGMLRRQNVISELVFEAPHLFLEVDEKGRMIFPFLAGGKGKASPAGKQNRFLLKNLRIRSGTLDYLDRSIASTPALIKLSDIQLEASNIYFPLDDIVSNYRVAANIEGKLSRGLLKSRGTMNLRTKDTKSRVEIKTVDITSLKPYYQKKGDVDVTRGFLTLDADIAVAKSRLNSKGRIIIKDLEFRPRQGNKFLGLPQLAVVKLLRDTNNEIVLDFIIEGDLNNPKFSIKESIVRKITLSLAKVIGLPIESIGKSVLELGGSALKKLLQP
ncbi:MAG: DUF748 domain-containing protein [Nitrospirae bacterium]|nr:DUF748 domain-containing protein [Nitrospirota bacterium]